MILLGAGALPRGGAVTVGIVEPGEVLGLSVSAVGERAAMDTAIVAALRSETAGIDPLTAQPYLTARLVESLGGSIEVSSGADQVSLRADIAVAAPSD